MSDNMTAEQERKAIVDWLFDWATYYNGNKSPFIPKEQQEIIGAAIQALASKIDDGEHHMDTEIPSNNENS